MPRFRKKNNSAFYTALGMVVAAVGVMALVYFGGINFSSNSGKESKANTDSINQSGKAQ